MFSYGYNNAIAHHSNLLIHTQTRFSNIPPKPYHRPFIVGPPAIAISLPQARLLSNVHIIRETSGLTPCWCAEAFPCFSEVHRETKPRPADRVSLLYCCAFGNATLKFLMEIQYAIISEHLRLFVSDYGPYQ